MIILLNGSFAVGKTTNAELLVHVSIMLCFTILKS